MLVETSRSVHWYVELSAKSETAPLISRVVPYLDAFTDQQSLRFGGIEEMVDQTARQAVMKTDPLSREHARAYLDLVRVTLRKDKPVGGRRPAIGDGCPRRHAFRPSAGSPRA